MRAGRSRTGTAVPWPAIVLAMLGALVFVVPLLALVARAPWSSIECVELNKLPDDDTAGSNSKKKTVNHLYVCVKPHAAGGDDGEQNAAAAGSAPAAATATNDTIEV